MLWYCRFEWHAHTTRQQVAQRIIEQHQAANNRLSLPSLFTSIPKKSIIMQAAV